MPHTARRLRTHQAQIAAIARAIAADCAAEMTDILAAVTPAAPVAAVGGRDAGAADGGGRGRAPGAARREAVSLLQRDPETPMGGKARAQMSLAELETAVSWLGRHRLADHADVLDGDPRYGWTVRQRRE